jgi:glutaredoxin 3
MPDVTIYTTRFCGYCQAAKALLTKKGITFTEIDLTGDRAGRNALIQRADGRMTVPQIFIGRHHVGGYDDLYALDRAGRLDPLLAASAERAAEG